MNGVVPRGVGLWRPEAASGIDRFSGLTIRRLESRVWRSRGRAGSSLKRGATNARRNGSRAASSKRAGAASDSASGVFVTSFCAAPAASCGRLASAGRGHAATRAGKSLSASPGFATGAARRGHAMRINTQAMQPATANPITFFFFMALWATLYREEGGRRKEKGGIAETRSLGRIRFTERWGFWFLVSS